jgi:Zn-dependent protease
MFSLADNPLILIISLLALVMAIAIHEFAHAFAADRLGDPTPQLQGRLTLNPLAHLDFLGSIMILLAGFGWGKPVQFDPFNLRNPRRDAAIISIAGPLSNFTLAIICSLLLHIVPFGILSFILEPFIIINISLGVFNLVPIHPLDGFKIVGGILPEKYAKQWYELEGYGMIFLLFLAFPILTNVSPISRVISPIIRTLIQLLLPGNGGIV